jgi:hypothetical protein
MAIRADLDEGNGSTVINIAEVGDAYMTIFTIGSQLVKALCLYII